MKTDRGAHDSSIVYSIVQTANEFICSKIASILGFNHVEYELLEYKGILATKCELITNKDISIVTASAFNRYASFQGIDIDGDSGVVKWLMNSHFKHFMEMILFDGIINNSDRHLENWGFFMDNDTGELISLHPILDNNMALYTGSRQYKSQIFQTMTLLDAGTMAFNNLDRPSL